MAVSAVAQETLCALRRAIARIEDAPPALLSGGGAEPVAPQAGLGCGAAANDEDHCGILMRYGGRPPAFVLATGADAFDLALGGGLPLAALSEIIAADTRDAAAAAAFALTLAGKLALEGGGSRRPVLFAADSQSLAEGGMLHAPAITALTGLGADRLIFASAGRPADVLWIAGEAAALPGLSAVIVEIRGTAACLSLAATQRLNRRAAAAGRPVFLLRQRAGPQPTAAPVRLLVTPAPATERNAFGYPVAGTLGAPAFSVTISKSRTAPPATHVLEWSRHELRYRQRQPAHPGRRLSLPADRPAAAPAAWAALEDGARRRSA